MPMPRPCRTRHHRTKSGMGGACWFQFLCYFETADRTASKTPASGSRLRLPCGCLRIAVTHPSTINSIGPTAWHFHRRRKCCLPREDRNGSSSAVVHDRRWRQLMPHSSRARWEAMTAALGPNGTLALQNDKARVATLPWRRWIGSRWHANQERTKRFTWAGGPRSPYSGLMRNDL